MIWNRNPAFVNTRLYLSGFGSCAIVTCMDATGTLVFPFQSHSSIPPPLLMALVSLSGALCSRPRTSMRLDLPEPFRADEHVERAKLDGRRLIAERQQVLDS